MPPTVSINLCCYNSEKYLEETLESIFAQTYKDWELVIVNDGSTDSTERIIQKYIADGWPIVYHYQPNAGLGMSRNKAIELSQGKFIAFIDHDDLWMPQKLEKQIPLFDDLEVALVFCDTVFFNEAGQSRRMYSYRNYYTGWCFSKLLTDYFLSVQTVVIRRTALNYEQMWFDPRFQMIEEADLFRRMAYRWKLNMVNEPLAKWRVHKDSLTWTKGYLFADETELMLEAYAATIPAFAERYSPEIQTVKKRIAVTRATHLWKQKRTSDARKCLSPFLWKNAKVFCLFLMTFLPADRIQPLMNKVRGYTVPG